MTVTGVATQNNNADNRKIVLCIEILIIAVAVVRVLVIVIGKVIVVVVVVVVIIAIIVIPMHLKNSHISVRLGLHVRTFAEVSVYN